MLTVIIPAYNEEDRIGATIEAVIEYGRAGCLDIDILVVDDGSEDNTAAVARAHDGVEVIGSPINRGKGWAVREGMSRATGDLVMFTDADMSTPITEASRLMGKIREGHDVAVGSRMARPRRIERYQPLRRMAAGLLFGEVVRIMFAPGVRDTQCGFKMFTSEAAKKLSRLMTVDGFAFDVEMLVLAHRMGMKVAETPVIWRDMPGSKVSLLGDLPATVRELAAIRRRLKRMNAGEIEEP